MSNSNEKTKLELTLLLLQRFHSTEAQNGTFGPDCRSAEGKRMFGSGLGIVLRRSWGGLGANLEPTWSRLKPTSINLELT